MPSFSFHHPPLFFLLGKREREDLIDRSFALNRRRSRPHISAPAAPRVREASTISTRPTIELPKTTIIEWTKATTSDDDCPPSFLPSLLSQLSSLLAINPFIPPLRPDDEELLRVETDRLIRRTSTM